MWRAIMKKITNLGSALTRNEAKEVVGGKLSLFCTCTDSNLDTIVCSASTLLQAYNCAVAVEQYCENKGYQGFACVGSGSL
jgi:hypothetical protein